MSEQFMNCPDIKIGGQSGSPFARGRGLLILIIRVFFILLVLPFSFG